MAIIACKAGFFMLVGYSENCMVVFVHIVLAAFEIQATFKLKVLIIRGKKK